MFTRQSSITKSVIEYKKAKSKWSDRDRPTGWQIDVKETSRKQKQKTDEGSNQSTLKGFLKMIERQTESTEASTVKIMRQLWTEKTPSFIFYKFQQNKKSKTTPHKRCSTVMKSDYPQSLLRGVDAPCILTYGESWLPVQLIIRRHCK